jgi:hypothetical protein
MILALATAHLTLAAPLKATWTASSVASSAETPYDAANLGDGKVQKAWVEGESGAGLGAWALADLGGTQNVSGVTVWGGSWADAEAHAHYARPKVLIVEFSDGKTEELTLDDAYRAQFLPFKAAHATSSLKFKIKAVHNGKGPDTALSEIWIHDTVPAKDARVASATASSTYSESYDAFNAADGALDAIWCEGDSAGDGTNSWLEVTFAQPTSISSMAARIGVAYSFPFFMKSNRPTTATLTFADGSTSQVTFADKPAEQVLTFPERTTSKVRITLTGVKKGSEFNDLCLADVAFR